MAKAAKPVHPANDPSTPPETLATLLGQDSATDRLLAKHPRGSADLLEKLSHSSDKATRAQVTANPNTPSQTYLRLGAQFPQEFLANPILDLLLIENPVLLHELPDTMLVQIMRKPLCPPHILTWAAAHANAKVQLAVAMNAKAPPEALERLRHSAHEAVRETLEQSLYQQADSHSAEVLFTQAMRNWLGALSVEEARKAWEKGDIGLAQFPALEPAVRLVLAKAPPMSQKDPLEQLTSIDDAALRVAVAQNPATPVATLDELQRWGRKVGMAVAGNPSTSPETLKKNLAGSPGTDRRLDIRLAVAKNPNTPGDVLIKLTKLESRDLYLYAIENPNLPVTFLEEMATHAKYMVRRAAANNPSTPVASLQKLAQEKDYRIRSRMAGIPHTPLALLEVLSADVDGSVRHEVAKNPSTPAATLEKLALDKNMRCRVAENPNTPAATLEKLTLDEEWYVRSSVAENPNTPAATLEKLALDEDVYVRRAVARNPSTPAATLEKVTLGQDWSGVVAENPSTPAATLEKLALDQDWSVRVAVAKNPNAPAATLEKLALDKKEDVLHAVARNPSTPAATLEELALDTKNWVRQAVAENPNTPSATLEKLALDKKEKVAANSNTPAATLEKLALDKDESVRGAVAKNPNAPAATLEKLALDKKEDVRHAVARNPSTPASLLEQMAEYPDIEIVARVAANPHTPLELLEGWATHSRTKWRTGVAANPSAPCALLEHLARDKGVAVRTAVAGNPSAPSALLEQLVRDKNAAVRTALAGNPATPAPVLSKLGGDKGADIRQTLLLCRRAPADLRLALYSDLAKRLKVAQRTALAQDPTAPADLLRTLTHDPALVVYLSAWANPATPADARQALEDRLRSANPGQNPGCQMLWAKATAELRTAVQTGDILYSTAQKAESNVLSARRSARLMSLCARGSAIPPARLARVSVSTDWLTRAAVARHPDTPPNLRKKLAEDVHPLVAALAKMAGL